MKQINVIQYQRSLKILSGISNYKKNLKLYAFLMWWFKVPAESLQKIFYFHFKFKYLKYTWKSMVMRKFLNLVVKKSLRSWQKKYICIWTKGKLVFPEQRLKKSRLKHESNLYAKLSITLQSPQQDHNQHDAAFTILFMKIPRASIMKLLKSNCINFT